MSVRQPDGTTKKQIKDAADSFDALDRQLERTVVMDPDQTPRSPVPGPLCLHLHTSALSALAVWQEGCPLAWHSTPLQRSVRAPRSSCPCRSPAHTGHCSCRHLRAHLRMCTAHAQRHDMQMTTEACWLCPVWPKLGMNYKHMQGPSSSKGQTHDETNGTCRVTECLMGP